MTSQLAALTRSFRQLRWKLTLSYTAVTVGALLIGELLLLAISVGALYFVLAGDAFPSLVAGEMRRTIAPEIAPYLDQEPPDLAGLAEWLRAPGGSTTPEGLQIQTDADEDARIYVIDTDQVLLATQPEPADGMSVGEPLPAEMLSAVQPLIDHALTEGAEAGDLYIRTPEALLLAAPIIGNDDRVLGVLILEISLNAGLAASVVPLAQTVGISLLCLVPSAGTIGTFFGFVTARGLTRRLKRLTDASDAWSQGRFSTFVDDASADEVGQLATRLNRMAQQLQNLLDTRQELAVVEERNRLARDLHDSAKQQAFAAAAQIGAAKALISRDPAAAGVHIGEAEQLINALRRELSALILELRPPELANQGLAAALKNYAADWSRQTGIDALVRVQGERPLSLEIEQTLFRIAQEALANIARHSHATRAEIWLGYEPKSVTLTIQDNGYGFDPAVAAGGFGLRSMRDRAEALGGTLTVESTSGSGTLITITCETEDSTL